MALEKFTILPVPPAVDAPTRTFLDDFQRRLQPIVNDEVSGVTITADNIDSESATDGWVLTADGLGGAAWEVAPGAGGGLDNVVEDLTPQLGGDLDVNGMKITSVSNGDIDIEPSGSGDVLLGNYRFDVDQAVDGTVDDYALTYDHSTGRISLEESNGGLTPRQVMSLTGLRA